MQDHFSGKGRNVETEKEKERGPDCFRTMAAGQSSQLYFLGYIGGGKFGDQPVFYSKLLGHAFALPAHTILLDKLREVEKLSPCIVTCDAVPEKGTQKAWRYSVQVFDVVTDKESIRTLSDAWDDFVERVKAQRGAASDSSGPRGTGQKAPF